MAAREVTNSELTAAPYSAVGLIFVRWPDGALTQGTVAMVGPNDVLTATHVIYDPARGGLAASFDLFFGVDFNSVTDRFDSSTNSWVMKAGTFAWDALRFPERVFTDSDPGVAFSESQYDVAVIGLSVPVGRATGWFGIDPARDFAQTVTEIGYPDNGTGMMTGTVNVERNSNYGVYLASGDGLGPGSSGGPLFSSDFYVIGVKSGGSGGLSSWADLGMVSDSVFSYIANNDWILSVHVPTVAEKDDALSVFRGYYGRAPDSTEYRAIELDVGSSSVESYSIRVDANFAAETSPSLSSRVLGDLGISPFTLGGSDPTASYNALQVALGEYFGAYPGARGKVVMQLTSILEALQGDAVYGAAARAFEARVEADLVGVTPAAVA